MTHAPTQPQPGFTLPERAQQLIDAGRLPVPGRGMALLKKGEDPRGRRYTADDFDHPRVTDVQILLGLQPSGRYLYVVDLDTHKASQDADAARATFEQQHPHIAHKIAWTRSRSGKGWHGHFETYKPLPTGGLYDADGCHIGELLADRILDPGDLHIQTLNLTEIERMFSSWHVARAIEGGERWSDRAKEGQRYAAGWKRITRKELRAALHTYCGKVGAHLAEKLDTAEVGERSDLAAHLMQCLMLHAHRMAGWDTSFYEKCRTVMAYWMAADSFGKAQEKDYSQEKDGYSLLAQIVNGDPFGDGRRWTTPFWAKSIGYGLTNSSPESDPLPRPRGRPAGSSDKPKRIARLRRALDAIEPDDFGRRSYLLDVLAERLKTPRRTLQADLRILRGDDQPEGSQPEIATGQIGGNGRPYAVLTCHFGGANKSPKADKTLSPFVDNRGASEAPIERTAMPKNADRNDNVNKVGGSPQPCVPSGLAPGGALGGGDPLPAATPDEWAGIEEELAAFVPPVDREPKIRPWGWGEHWTQWGASIQQDRPAPPRAPPIEAQPQLPLVYGVLHWPDSLWEWEQQRDFDDASASGATSESEPLAMYARLREQREQRIGAAL